jgi:hypothetical protein
MLTGQPKMHKCEIFGFSPVSLNHGISPSFAQVGLQFRRYDIIFTAIDHKFFGSFAA